MSSRVIPILLLLLLLVLAAWWMLRPGEEAVPLQQNTNVAGSNTSGSDSSIPFAYAVPTGWEAERMEFGINVVKGGGPMQSLYLTPPHGDANFAEFADPSVTVFWYHLNPAAPLGDIPPVIMENQRKSYTTEAAMLGGRDAIRIVSLASANAQTTDSEPPAFRAEYLVARLPDARLLEVQIIYNQESSYRSYRSDVDAFVGSIAFTE